MGNEQEDVKHDHDKKIEIVVNGRQDEWKEETISYEQVVKLAKLSGGPATDYKITYDHGPAENRQGHLDPGQSVEVKSGMIFHATPTDRS